MTARTASSRSSRSCSILARIWRSSSLVLSSSSFWAEVTVWRMRFQDSKSVDALLSDDSASLLNVESCGKKV